MRKRKRLWHVPPAQVGNGAWFFLTVCCATRGRAQLDKREIFNVMSAAVEYYVAAGKWRVGIFLAMPDHWHALAEFPDPSDMANVVRNWKRFVAKRTGVVWQDGFFDRRLRTLSDILEKWEYIRSNPVKAGLVPSPEAWRYSWMGDENVLSAWGRAGCPWAAGFGSGALGITRHHPAD